MASRGATRPSHPLTNDGKWTVAANPAGSDGVFKTRLVVYRPIDAARFNGTVVVEWLNVSAGGDIATDWIMAHNEFVRSGTVWVGVSAQSVGVNNLKTNDSARYGSLVHPGDSYSYDMFSIAGRDIRQNVATVLGGLQPDRLIATGESQSAGRLVTYLDAVQPSARVYDGFMVHSRGAGGARLTQPPLPDVPVPSPLQIRNDLDVPVFVVEAEGDVIGSNLGARQPNTARFRLWELAGTSHADAYTVNVGFNDIGNSQGAVQMFGFMRNPLAIGCGKPINAGPHHWLLQAAFHHLDAWVRSGVAPPVGPPLDVVSTTPRRARARRAGQCARRRTVAAGRRARRDARQPEHRRRVLHLVREHDPVDAAAARRALPDARGLRGGVARVAHERHARRFHPPGRRVRALRRGRQLPSPELSGPSQDRQARGYGTGKSSLPGQTVISRIRPSSATSQKSVPGPMPPSGSFQTKL